MAKLAQNWNSIVGANILMLQHKSCTVQCQFLNITCIKFWTKRTCFKCSISQCQNFWKVLNNIQACQKWRKRNCCVVITLVKGPNNARPANGCVAKMLLLVHSTKLINHGMPPVLIWFVFHLFLPDSDIRCIQVTTPWKYINLARKLRKNHKKWYETEISFPLWVFFCLKNSRFNKEQLGNSWS